MKRAYGLLTGADELKETENAEVVRIPWAQLRLEPKHFAHGGNISPLPSIPAFVSYLPNR